MDAKSDAKWLLDAARVACDNMHTMEQELGAGACHQ